MRLEVADLAPKLKPYVLGWLSDAGVSLDGNYAPSPHDMNGVHHAGAIADDQAPQFALKVTTVTAGAGLTGGGTLAANFGLAVGAGTLITVGADAVGITPGSADYGYIGSSTTPWTATWRNISTLAGAGLTHATGVLAVGAGTLITVAADTVGITPGSAQYQYIVSGANPYTAAWSGGYLNITTTKTLTVSDSTTLANASITLANAKVLTLTGSLTAELDSVVNQDLTTDAGPSFAHLHLTDLAAIYTPAESWIGPSATVGIYFKTGNVGIGTTTPRKLADFLSTTQAQLRLTYTDNSIYSDFLVGVAGSLLITPTGGFVEIEGDLRFVGAQAIRTTADSLTLAPVADLDLTPGGTARVRATAGVRLQSDNFVSQTTGWGISYAGGGDFRYLYADEMHVKSFIADLEQALAGGQIICKSVAPLAANFTVPPASGNSDLIVESFKGFPTFKVFVDSDVVRLRQFVRSGTTLTIANCWGTVVWTSTDEANKTQTYTFTRSASPNQGDIADWGTIYAGSLALDYGTSGNGYLESNAIDGAMAEYAPYHQIVTWTTHPNVTLSIKTRLGNLKGIFNTANEYGLFAGDGVTDSSKYLRISNTSVEAHNLPIKMYDGASVTMAFDPTVPSFAMGSTLPTGYSTGDGLWMGKGAGVYKFRVSVIGGAGLYWDGANVTIAASTGNYIWLNGNNILINANGTQVLLITSAPSILIGQAAANQNNIRILAGAIEIRNNTTVRILLSADGSGFLASTNISWDTSGNATIAGWSITSTAISNAGGTVLLRGAGNLAFGTTPPTSPTVGTGVFIDSTGIFGLNASVQQFKLLTADGKAYAGGGNVILDANGISLNTGSGSSSKIKWYTGAAEIAALRVWTAGVWLNMPATVGHASRILVNCVDYTTGVGASLDLCPTTGLERTILGIGSRSLILDSSGLATWNGEASIATRLFINESSNANQTYGLTINQGASVNEIVSLKNGMAHGITSITETDTWGLIKNSVTTGGWYQAAFRTGHTAAYLLLSVTDTNDTAKTTAAYAPLTLTAAKMSAPNLVDMGANANLLVVRNNATTRFILDADGDSHQDVGTAWTNFDDENDLELLSAACALLERDSLKKGFLETLEANRDLLSRLRIVAFNEDGHHFVNWSRMNMLIIGAIRQLARRMYETSGVT